MPRTPSPRHNRSHGPRDEDNAPASGHSRRSNASPQTLHHKQAPRKGGNRRRPNSRRVALLRAPTGGDGAARQRRHGVRQAENLPVEAKEKARPTPWRRDKETLIHLTSEEAWTLDLGAVRACVYRPISTDQKKEWRAKVIGAGFYATNLGGHYATRKQAIRAVELAARTLLTKSLAKVERIIATRR